MENLLMIFKAIIVIISVCFMTVCLVLPIIFLMDKFDKDLQKRSKKYGSNNN